MTIWRMRIACWITIATHTLTQYVTLIVFTTAAMAVGMRLNVLLYVHYLSCLKKKIRHAFHAQYISYVFLVGRVRPIT